MRPRVVLANLGTTSAPEPNAVSAFLSEFLSDPMVVDYPSWLWKPILKRILASRPKRVAEQYRSIWTDDGSPLHVGSHRIADALASALGCEVRVAFRYGAPALAAALEHRPIVVPLFPQRTGSSTGTIERLVEEKATLRCIPPDAAGYVEAQAELCERAVGDRPPEHVVVSFHGIPARYDRAEGGSYRRDCEATYSALLKRLGWPDALATLVYQSRFGPEPWIGPSTAKVLRRLGRSGVRSIAVVTPGFVTEGLETAEEIGIRGRRAFLEAGGERFVRVPCVESHPAFVETLAELVRQEIQ